MTRTLRAPLRCSLIAPRLSAALLLTLAGGCDEPTEADLEAEAGVITERDTVFDTMPAPVGFWHLDEDCGDTVVLDDSSLANHGQRIGGAGCVAGKTDRAASFDGVDDRVEIADRPAYHFTTAMTAAAWVKPGAVSGLRTIVNKWYAADSYSLIVADGQYNFSVALAGGGAHHQVVAPATAGVWAHVAGVWDGKKLSLYVDGALAASKVVSTVPRALQDSPRPLEIGNHPSWNAFAGQIDEVRLYGAALSPAQVKSLTRTVYHVARTGLDTNPGTKARPFRTLAKGALMAQAGDTVLARAFRFVDRFGRRDRGKHFNNVKIVSAECVIGGVNARDDCGGEKQTDENEGCDEDAPAGFEVGAVQIGFNKLVEHKQFLLKFSGAIRIG